jgi:glycosyltransferase involved in cell wall biosynthesis
VRIAVVIPTEWFANWSLNPLWLLDGVAECGHEPLLVARSGSSEPAGIPFRLASASELASARYWRSLNLDLAVVLTWMAGFNEVLHALRDAKVFTVSKGDTDGLLGVRIFRRAEFVRTVFAQRTPLGRARAVWHWAKKYAALYKREDSAVLTNLRTADVTIVETEVARVNLTRFLSLYRAEDLTPRLHVVPPWLSHHVVSASVPRARDRTVVSVGRWDDPQKNVRLLRRTCRRLLDSDPAVRLLIIGGEGCESFQRLDGDRVQYVAPVDHRHIPDLLTQAQVYLGTSRWEGCYQAAHEAVALGCTVVGTDIPAVREVVDGGRFGRFSCARSRELAAAVDAELCSWDDGERDPEQISAHWRARVAPRAVAAKIAELPELDRQ